MKNLLTINATTRFIFSIGQTSHRVINVLDKQQFLLINNIRQMTSHSDYLYFQTILDNTDRQFTVIEYRYIFLKEFRHRISRLIYPNLDQKIQASEQKEKEQSKQRSKEQIQINVNQSAQKGESKNIKKQVNQSLAQTIQPQEQQHIKNPIKPLHRDIKSIEQIPNLIPFFIGDVLDDQEDYKLFLFSYIQSNFQARIKRTPLLFNYHPKRSQNFHPFIDGVSPFIFLAKTSSGYHIAAISQGQLNPRKHEQKRGWIISLTNRKVYPSIPGKSAISYDQVYLIFGNQQLRIQGSSLNISSNFGMHSGYYDSGGDKLSSLFGEHKKEIELQAFEIFKIQFM